jgi:hypothetical protein
MSQRSKFFPLLIVLLAAAEMRLAAQPGPLAPYGPKSSSPAKSIPSPFP